MSTAQSTFEERVARPGSPPTSDAQRLRIALIDRLARDLASSGVRRIALFGAGRHTRPIVREPWARHGITVAAIVDDKPATPSLAGIPVRTPAEAAGSPDFDAIVVSSWSYEFQLFERAQATLGGLGLPIRRIYDDTDERFESEAAADTLVNEHGLEPADARWLVENRGERHDALLPLLPAARTELHLRRYELAADIARRAGATRVLDAACGTGYGSTLFATDALTTYTGVDIDASTVAYAGRRYGTESASFVCASATDTGLPDASVDLVASFETIEHLEDTEGLLAEYERVLTPDGLLVVSTPNELGPTPYHVHDFSRDAFLSAIESRFEVVAVYGQLPQDGVASPELPPGIWTSPAHDDDAPAGHDLGCRPDFLIAVARKRGASGAVDLPTAGAEPSGAPPTAEHATVCITTRHGDIQFFCPNDATRWRARSLNDKEPETLDWIDRFDPGDVYWDIGASTGPYVMYAAKAGVAGSIIALEPSAWNYWVLSEQLKRAGLGDTVRAFPVALGDTDHLDALQMRHPLPGGAGSSLGEPIGEFGEAFEPEFSQGAVGITIDTLVEQFGLEVPNRIKIDVDGLEKSVLQGGLRTLANPAVKSIAIELDSGRDELIGEVTAMLAGCGLELVARRHAAFVDATPNAAIFNYEFTRATPDA